MPLTVFDRTGAKLKKARLVAIHVGCGGESIEQARRVASMGWYGWELD